MYHPSSAWDKFDDPEPYREFFKDHCCICGLEIPKEWSHYKFFGNYCIGCDRKISKKLNTNIMLRETYQIHQQQMQGLWDIIMGQHLTPTEKQEIINDKIKDEYKNEERTDRGSESEA